MFLLSIAISLQVASSPAVRQCNVADDQHTYKNKKRDEQSTENTFI